VLGLITLIKPFFHKKFAVGEHDIKDGDAIILRKTREVFKKEILFAKRLWGPW
jgi:hypothetical protein